PAQAGVGRVLTIYAATLAALEHALWLRKSDGAATSQRRPTTMAVPPGEPAQHASRWRFRSQVEAAQARGRVQAPLPRSGKGAPGHPARGSERPAEPHRTAPPAAAPHRARRPADA